MSEKSQFVETGKTIAEQLDALFAPWSRTDAPGLVVGVRHAGGQIYRRGFGMASLETSVVNSPKTRMRIGSTSKHFTSLLALLLAEDGKFDLDKPIRTYIPELSGSGGDPTARLLLQHRGGSRCHLDLGFIFHGAAVSARGTGLATLIRQTGRNFAPGEAMIYNNGGYHLVSIALERVGSAPFEAQLKSRLFDVVGMPDTESIPSDYEITPGIATMHFPDASGRLYRGLFPSIELRGEGGIVSTIDDMLHWMAHLRAQDKFGSPEIWKQLFELPVYPDGATGRYSLGLVTNSYRGLKTISHAGGVAGGSCQMMMLPGHALDIIIIANVANAGAAGVDPGRLAERVIDIVLSDHVGEPAKTLAAQDYRALLGAWWSPQTGMIYSLNDEQGTLKFSVGEASTGLPLERTADGRVVVQEVTNGEIAVGIDKAVSDGPLEISFGGKTAAYHRVSTNATDGAAFARAVEGRYVSNDGGGTATILLEGDELIIRCADAYGKTEAKVVPVSEMFGYTQPRLNSVLGMALSFARRDDKVTGFRLNTWRTRNLEFERA